MRVLVACEFSGVVRRAFRRYGHEAWSCDIISSLDNSPNHIVGDALSVVGASSWDIVIAHPPCTYLAYSGMHWTWRGHRDVDLTVQAAWFAARILNADAPRVCIENPRSILDKYLGASDQIIQPYNFGDDLSKETHLWLRGLPPLISSIRRLGSYVHGRERFGNQTPSGNDRTPPAADRGRVRSVTSLGLAEAMAIQWGGLP